MLIVITYFCLGLLDLSGIVIFNNLSLRNGFKIFVLKYSLYLKLINYIKKRDNRQYD